MRGFGFDFDLAEKGRKQKIPENTHTGNSDYYAAYNERLCPQAIMTIAKHNKADTSKANSDADCNHLQFLTFIQARHCYLKSFDPASFSPLFRGHCLLRQALHFFLMGLILRSTFDSAHNQMDNIGMLKKLANTFFYSAVFGLFSVIYLFGAAYWDDIENEHLIYNYSWNFRLIDLFVWKVIPAFIFLFYVRSLVKTWKRGK
jgi:hypothetical protein